MPENDYVHSEKVVAERLKAAEARIQTLRTSVSYIESQWFYQNQLSKQYSDERDNFKAALELIVNNICGAEHAEVSLEEYETWDPNTKALFVIRNVNMKLLAYHNKVLESQESMQKTISEKEKILATVVKESNNWIPDVNNDTQILTSPPNTASDNPATDSKFSSLIHHTIPTTINRFDRNKQNTLAAESMRSTLNQIRSALDPIKEEIIFTIGDTGEFEVSRIEKLLNERGQKSSSIQNHFSVLETKCYLRVINDKFSYKQGRSAKVYELTDTGINAYKILAKEKYKDNREPVKCLYHEYILRHKSPEHGAIIRDVAEKLEKNGYLISLEDSISSDEGRTQCDILAERDEISHRIEIECGNYSSAAMQDKLTRILAVSPDLLFVCKDKSIVNNILPLVRAALIDKTGNPRMDIDKYQATTGGVVSIISQDEFFKKKDWPSELIPKKQ